MHSDTKNKRNNYKGDEMIILPRSSMKGEEREGDPYSKMALRGIRKEERG